MTPEAIKKSIDNLKQVEQYYYDQYKRMRRMIKEQIDQLVKACSHVNVTLLNDPGGFEYEGPTCTDCGARRKLIGPDFDDQKFEGEWYSTFKV